METLTAPAPQTVAQTEVGPFTLDIRVLEIGDETFPLIQVTDDGCSPTCPGSCASNA